MWNEIIARRAAGHRTVVGMMLESDLVEGNQPLPADLSQLRRGVSITDPCIGWDETERLLRDAHAALSRPR